MIEQPTKMADPQPMGSPGSKWPARNEPYAKPKETTTDDYEEGSESDPESPPTELEIEMAIKTLKTMS